MVDSSKFTSNKKILGKFVVKLCPKIKHVSMHTCYLTIETNCRVWIANETKLQDVKSSYWNFGM